VHLGHNGYPCPIPGYTVDDFTVINTSGVHSVDVQFCGCYGTVGGSHPRIQLLRAGLLPSTHTRPISAFTFDVLDSFHLLTLQGKTSAYDFYLSLVHKSDNTGLLDTKVLITQSIALPNADIETFRVAMNNFCRPSECGVTSNYSSEQGALMIPWVWQLRSPASVLLSVRHAHTPTVISRRDGRMLPWEFGKLTVFPCASSSLIPLSDGFIA
jgi:hypothetical protein